MKQMKYFSSFFSLKHQDSSQIELLKELMDLQKDMVVMLLSMLEGTLEFIRTTVTNRNMKTGLRGLLGFTVT